MFKVNFQGGEPSHQLTEKELAEHNHDFTGNSEWGAFTCMSSSRDKWSNGIFSLYKDDHGGGYKTDGIDDHISYQISFTPSGTISNTGGNQAHNNMPPYLTVKMWIRIA